MKTLSKILKGAAHPFIGFLPAQEKLGEKISWYNLYLGIGTSSTLEIIPPLIYMSTNPSPAKIALGISLVLDGMWRLNRLTEVTNPFEKRKYLGSLFLEFPYEIGKFMYNSFKKKEPVKI